MIVLQTQVQVGCIIHSGSHFGKLRTELLVPVIPSPCIVSLLRQVFRFSLALPGLLSASSSHSFRYVTNMSKVSFSLVLLTLILHAVGPMKCRSVAVTEIISQ